VPTTFVQVPTDLNPPVDPSTRSRSAPRTSSPTPPTRSTPRWNGTTVRAAWSRWRVYRKKIDGYIGPITDQSILCPASGTDPGPGHALGTLTIDTSAGTPKCMSSNQFVGAGGVLKNAQVNISGKTNQSADDRHRRRVQHPAEPRLPAGLLEELRWRVQLLVHQDRRQGHGGQQHHLAQRVEEQPQRHRLLRSRKFGVRLVYNWRDKYDLAAGNSFVGDARTVKARSQLDASASYQITKTLTISADAFNLTDATRSEYENDPMLPRRIDYDGRTYQLTMRAKF
jgi:hypothetical protein